jgi:hypothetical protein
MYVFFLVLGEITHGRIWRGGGGLGGPADMAPIAYLGGNPEHDTLVASRRGLNVPIVR